MRQIIRIAVVTVAAFILSVLSFGCGTPTAPTATAPPLPPWIITDVQTGVFALDEANR